MDQQNVCRLIRLPTSGPNSSGRMEIIRIYAAKLFLFTRKISSSATFFFPLPFHGSYFFLFQITTCEKVIRKVISGNNEMVSSFVWGEKLFRLDLISNAVWIEKCLPSPVKKKKKKKRRKGRIMGLSTPNPVTVHHLSNGVCIRWSTSGL